MDDLSTVVRGCTVITIVGVGSGLSIMLSTMLSTEMFPGLVIGLGGGLDVGLSTGLRYGLITVLASLILEAQAEGISLTERLHWTWHSLRRSMLIPKHMREALLVASVIGLIFGLSNGLHYGLLGGLIIIIYGTHTELAIDGLAGLSNGLSNGLGYGLGMGLSIGLVYWLLLGLLQGVSRQQIEDHTRHIPDQGIRRSFYNSILMALISAAIIGVVGGLDWGLSWGLSNGLSYALEGGLEYGLNNGLLYEWPIGLSGGLLVCAAFGGLAALRHGILRLRLWCTGATPRYYVRFLDEAARCILLRKVGGGYIFLHRFLLDYFADLETEPGPDETGETST